MATIAVASVASPASAAGPFTCRPGFYQVISGQLKILNPLTGVYSDIGVQGETYNAIGYNPRDNYIYGWGTAGAIQNQLVKVDSAGSVTALGAAGAATGNWVSGDFDDNNNLYFRKNNTTLIKINVAANPPTSTELTLTGGNFVGVDMGWIADAMYSLDGSTLYRVNLSTLVVSSASIADLSSPAGKEIPTSGSHSYGALFSNREDELYASHNSTGRIYRITDYTTSSPKGTWVIDGTVTSNNDGAACKQAVSPFSVPTATNDSYAATSGSTLTVNTASGILTNDGAATPTVLSNTNPASGTLAMNPDGSFTFTPAAGFVGTTTFTYVAQDQWGRSTATATVTINVAAPTSTTTAPTTTAATLAARALTSGSAATAPSADLPSSGTDSRIVIIGLMLAAVGAGLLSVRRHRDAPRT